MKIATVRKSLLALVLAGSTVIAVAVVAGWLSVEPCVHFDVNARPCTRCAKPATAWIELGRSVDDKVCGGAWCDEHAEQLTWFASNGYAPPVLWRCAIVSRK